MKIVRSAVVALLIMCSGEFVAVTAMAEVLPAKKSGVSCDQGALTTYNAYMAAQRAVLQAYESEVARARDAYSLSLKTGTRLQRKTAKHNFEASKATALINRNAALSQLGPKPKFPVGCRNSQS